MISNLTQIRHSGTERAWSCVLLALTLILCISFSAAAGGFTYEHDPLDNPHAAADIVRDDEAVYGYRPSTTGSLAVYADEDWFDAEKVEGWRQERIAYHESIEAMYTLLEEMSAAGNTAEEIARAVSTKRNELRLAAVADDPEALEKLKARNLEKYGHEEGPLPDELYAQYGSWETVAEKAFSPNPGMDACLGLYDDYYDVYVALGQIDDAAAPTSDTAPAYIYILITAVIAAAGCITARKKLTK